MDPHKTFWRCVDVVLVGALIVSVVIVARAFRMSDPQPFVFTRSQFFRLELACNEYRSDAKVWPSPNNWKQELDSYLGSTLADRAFLDGWGSDLTLMKPDPEAPLVIHSNGPNRKDDAGGGDDIQWEVALIEFKETH